MNLDISNNLKYKQISKVVYKESVKGKIDKMKYTKPLHVIYSIYKLTI